MDDNGGKRHEDKDSSGSNISSSMSNPLGRGASVLAGVDYSVSV